MLDLVLPQRCVVCGRRGTQLCSACLSELPRIEPPLCERCGTPTAWPVRRCRDCAGRRLAFASARGAVHYDDAVRAFIAAWKERALRRLAVAAVSVVIEVVDMVLVRERSATAAERQAGNAKSSTTQNARSMLITKVVGLGISER